MFKLRFFIKNLRSSLFFQEMNYLIHLPMPTSSYSRVCIMLFIISSISLMGCVYTQPIPSPSQQPYVQGGRADSVATVEPGEVRENLARTADESIQASHQPSELSRKELLMAQADTWAGTPHRWGGTTESGIDCSALVQRVYGESFNVVLPRTTREQVRVGKKIPGSQLEVGDLIFYRINLRTRHVGIYVGDNAFLHASKSEGVTISSLADPYWRSKYWMARRILDSEDKLVEAKEPQKKVQLTW